jgi:hypothetical protein
MNINSESELNKDKTTNSVLGAVSSRLNVYEYIWSKVFPNEELNYDDFYDWSRENANRALELALEYCDLNGC